MYDLTGEVQVVAPDLKDGGIGSWADEEGVMGYKEGTPGGRTSGQRPAGGNPGGHTTIGGRGAEAGWGCGRRCVKLKNQTTESHPTLHGS